MRKVGLVVAAVICCAALAVARADEGMWTFNQFPAAKVGAAYGFTPDAAWLNKLQMASVRIAGGCSAALVSSMGLVMTNHHCADECIQNVSGLLKTDFNRDGFIAAKPQDEHRCPGMELNQLMNITDVTATVQQATQGVAPERFGDARRATLARLEKECATNIEWRCDVVTLFRGGQYNLYRYRRFQDVRLVFAPEDQIAHFGGDPDNFNFPRYNLDLAFLRIYGADGKPWKGSSYLPFARSGVKEGELTFVSGNPGNTNRGMTVAQLEDQRDAALPWRMVRLAQLRGWITEYQQRGAEQLRHSNADLYGVENTLKLLKGQHQALADGLFFDALQQAERDFRAKVAADPALQSEYGDVWNRIAAIVQKGREPRRMFLALNDVYSSQLLFVARAIWRHAQEKAKPNGERLLEFTDGRMPQMAQRVLSDAPIDAEFEIAKLKHGLTALREELGADHPVVRALLGQRSPEQVATALVRGTRVGELTSGGGGPRKALWDADSATLAASGDPMLQFVAAYDEQVRAARKKFEAEVQGPLRKQEERLAEARFAVYGTSSYPDATFTLRLSFGRVAGWDEGGTTVPPFTDFAGIYRRHTGAEPFALPPSWLAMRGKVNLATPFNLVTDNDIVGGNSGSPMVNRQGEVVGLVFDGNIHSLGGQYGFDPRLNRTVAVHAQAILEALNRVYPAGHIAAELRAGMLPTR